MAVYFNEMRCDLELFVQLKKSEKHPQMSDNLSNVAG